MDKELSAPAPAGDAPPGFKMVPVTATTAMGLAGEEYARATRDRPKGAWWWCRLCEAMIEAAPAVPGDAPKGEGVKP